MKNIITSTIIFVLFSASLFAEIDPSKQENRTWTAITGHKIDGKLVKMENKIVSLLLKDDKTARIEFGQLSFDDQRYVQVAITGKGLEQLDDENKVVTVYQHPYGNRILFIKEDRTLWGIGNNGGGYFNTKEGIRKIITIPVLVATNVDRVILYDKSTFFLTRDNSCWRLDDYPMTKIGDNIRKVSGNFVLKMNGELWRWEIDGSYDRNGLYARNVADLLSLSLHHLSVPHYLLLKDGNLVYIPWSGGSPSPRKSCSGGVELVDLEGGDHDGALFLKQDRSLWYGRSWRGEGYSKQIAGPIARVVSSNCGYGGATVCVITQDGSLETINCGVKSKRQRDLSEHYYIDITKRQRIAGNVISARGEGENVWWYLTSDGTLSGWWQGSSASNVADAMGDDSRLFFVKRDGTLWGVGKIDKVIGKDSKSPIQIATDAKKILAANEYCLFFTKKNGTLWSVGQNSHGQLGDGTTINRTEPVKVKIPETPLSALKK